MTHRLFVAIDPATLTRSHIGRLQNKLARLNFPVIWEPAEKLHLTLNFLGRVPDLQTPFISTLLARIAVITPTFTLTPAFLETLYQRHGNSIIYIGFGGELDKLKHFQKSLSQSLSQLSFPQPRRFLPHLTIGRLKRVDPPTTKRFLDVIRAQDFRPLPTFTVDKIILYASFLSRAGSHHQKVREFLLKK